MLSLCTGNEGLTPSTIQNKVGGTPPLVCWLFMYDLHGTVLQTTAQQTQVLVLCVCVRSRIQARREEAEAELARVGPPARRQRRTLDEPGSPRQSAMSAPRQPVQIDIDLPAHAAHATFAHGGEAQAAGSNTPSIRLLYHLLIRHTIRLWYYLACVIAPTQSVSALGLKTACAMASYRLIIIKNVHVYTVQCQASGKIQYCM